VYGVPTAGSGGSGLVTFDPERAARSRLNRVHASLSDYSNSSVGDEVIVSHGRCRRRVAYPRRSQA
jgi:hypothetical protein